MAANRNLPVTGRGVDGAVAADGGTAAVTGIVGPGYWAGAKSTRRGQPAVTRGCR